MAEVKSAQVTISEFWPDHVHHKTVGKAPRWDTELGVVCACAEVLGWPDPERKETLSAYTRRVASEQVDAASAPGRVKGAFGTYGRPTPEPEDGESATALPGGDNTPEPGDYPEPETQTPEGLPAGDGRTAYDDLPFDVPEGDPGPAEPEDDPWPDTPDDEPEPDPAFTDPAVAQARRATGVHAITDVALPADEAQAGPPYAVGDTMTVGGIDFVKHSESPFPERNAPSLADAAGELADAGWNDGERTDEQEIADGSQAEYSRELAPVNEIGRDLVPYAGTPIMPTEAQELDPLTGRLAPLDPTLPYTPADVELKIVEILRQLENSELFLRQQLARLHQATHNHDFRYNLALAKSDQRAADQRKAEAWLATEKERHEMTEADMLVRALRDSQHNLRAQLSGFQSVARSLAVSMVNSLDGRERPPLPPEPPHWT